MTHESMISAMRERDDPGRTSMWTSLAPIETSRCKRLAPTNQVVPVMNILFLRSIIVISPKVSMVPHL